MGACTKGRGIEKLRRGLLRGRQIWIRDQIWTLRSEPGERVEVCCLSYRNRNSRLQSNDTSHFEVIEDRFGNTAGIESLPFANR